MSFVIAAPEAIQAAAQDLAGIRSALSQASAVVAGPTTGVVAAAEDEVSAGVAALFATFGYEYQALSAQVQAFHEQFVNVLSAGAGAYVSAEGFNVAQGLLNSVNVPTLALLGGQVSVAPYQSLVANTMGNLQSIGNTWANVTAPALSQALITQTNPQVITALESGNPLPMLAMSARIAQGYNNVMQALTVPVSLSITSLNPPNVSLAVELGLPQLLAFDAVGAPVNAAIAASASGSAFFNAVQTGNSLAAATALVDAPANIANAFLNGEQTIPMQLPVPGLSLTAGVPVAGLLVPPQSFTTTATLPANPLLQTVTITGPPVGGLVPTLLEEVPQLLASAFES